MYIIQLSTTSTNNANIYLKRGIMVFKNTEEYNTYKQKIAGRLNYSRKRRVHKMLDLNPWLPTSVATPMLYVEYRFKESEDWERDITTILE